MRLNSVKISKPEVRGVTVIGIQTDKVSEVSINDCPWSRSKAVIVLGIFLVSKESKFVLREEVDCRDGYTEASLRTQSFNSPVN